MIAFYFSGTGNSEYIARKFSVQMDIPCHSIEEDLRFHELLIRHSRIVICYPIYYCSGIPRLMREFAPKYRKDFYQKQVFVFCTQMLYSGDGARAFLDLFPENWLALVYAEHFLCLTISAMSFRRGPFGKRSLLMRFAVPTEKTRRSGRIFMPGRCGAADAVPYPAGSDGGSANISLRLRRRPKIMSAFIPIASAADDVPGTAPYRIFYGRMSTFSLRETACSVIDVSIYVRKKRSQSFITGLYPHGIKGLFRRRKGILWASIHRNMRGNKCRGKQNEQFPFQTAFC